MHRTHKYCYQTVESRASPSLLNPPSPMPPPQDAPDYERPLVQQMMTDTAAQALVDDFFHEHHFSTEDMSPFWGGNTYGTMSDSINMFATLRRAGVRAHVWP